MIYYLTDIKIKEVITMKLLDKFREMNPKKKRRIIILAIILILAIGMIVYELSDSYQNIDKNVREKAQFEVQSAGCTMTRRSGLVYRTNENAFVLRLNFNVPLINALSVNAKSAIRAVKDIMFNISKVLADFDHAELERYIKTYAHQQEIRNYMKEHRLCAFIANGSILPRENSTDMPMKNAIPFKSSDELLVKIGLSDGSIMEGMGIPYGITVITGGGYSGKSTLIDAIEMGIYNHIPGDAVRRVFGVLFQDYVTYCLPLREIIALSDFDERFNDEKLKHACDISGASEIIKDWEQGFDSVLGRYYADNGKDLSGGQWQLIGLARAYFKDSEYMILDEPSAALDPISEDRIFKQLYRLSEGKSSVTISHRLSNTTLADKIFVIGDGHIIEQGSHFELLKQNGKYAELFNLQASKYI